MRTRTFVLSFLVHGAVICAAMVVRLAATTELPVPPHATAFVIARAELTRRPASPGATRPVGVSADGDESGDPNRGA